MNYVVVQYLFRWKDIQYIPGKLNYIPEWRDFFYNRITVRALVKYKKILSYQDHILLDLTSFNNMSVLTWCPEQMDPPFGNRARKGLWTGQDVRGPHLDGPGNGTELKLLAFVAVGHGLHCGSGGPWNEEDWEGPKPLYPIMPPPPPPPFPIIIACGGGGGYDAATVGWPCGQLMPAEPIVRPGQPEWPLFEGPCPPPPPRLHWLAAMTMSPRLLPWWCERPPPPLAPQNWWSTAKLSWLPEHCRRWDEGGGDEFRE